MEESMTPSVEFVDGEYVAEAEAEDTLLNQIEYLKAHGDLLHHRLDSIQRLLDQETFQLQNVVIKPKTNQVRKLLSTLELDEDSLVLGTFLKALNKWLIKEDLVDLNDLQIHLSPLLIEAFQKPKGLKKIPYALLLNALPTMFS